ncbi:MAG: hypothetical protein K5853_05560 [Lachnospiraceae bacterium]|nr:hypothetical protein [Lachnospiraceae bacterium]
MSLEKNPIVKEKNLTLQKQTELEKTESNAFMQMDPVLMETQENKETVPLSPEVQRIGEVCRLFGQSLYKDSVSDQRGLVKPLMDHAREYHSDTVLEVGSSIGCVIKNFFVSKFSAVKTFFSRTDKKISDSSRELAQSIEGLMDDAVTKQRDENDPEMIDASLERMLRLSQAADMYYDTHRRTRITTEGAAMKELNNELREVANKALKDMLTPEEEKKVQDNTVKTAPGEITDMAKVEKEMKTFGQQYRYFALELGRETVMNTPRQRLELKLRFFQKYENEIRHYRWLAKIKGKEEMDRDAMYAVEAYENCLRWKIVLDKMPVKKEKEADEDLQAEMYRAVEEAVSKEDDRKTLEKDAKVKNGDDGLSKEQLASVDEIDKWLVRNYSNGGLKGIILAKNPHFDLMNQLFAMSKRERLMAYYLVQTDKRKNPSLLDAAVSQDFVPSLEEFKDKMLATKWAFWKRIDGSYTYMHKLASAFSYTREHTKEIEAMAELSKTKKEKKDDTPGGQKKEKVIELYKGLSEYQQILQKGAKEKNKKKQSALKATAMETAEYCEELFREIAQIDKNMVDAQVETPEFVKSDVMNKGATFGGFSKFGPMGIKMGMDKTSKFFGWGWGLDEAGWDKMKLWTGSFQSSLGAVGASLNMVAGIWSLAQDGGSLTAEEVASRVSVITRKGAEMLKNGADFVAGFLGGETTKVVTQVASETFSVVKAVTTGCKLTAEVAGLCNGSKAKKKSDLFIYGEVKDRIGKLDEKTGKRVGKKELNDREKRESKYKMEMSKLSDGLRSRDKMACFFTCIEFVGDTVDCVIPIVGKVISFIGFGLKKLFTGKHNQSIRDQLFDSYYNVAEVRNKMIAALMKKYPGDEMRVNQLSFKVTEAVRRKVAVQAGFADKTSATEHVARRYAQYIRDKLFDELPASEEEKEAYVNLLRSMGMKFNKEKNKPDLNVMIRKMCTK